MVWVGDSYGGWKVVGGVDSNSSLEKKRLLVDRLGKEEEEKSVDI